MRIHCYRKCERDRPLQLLCMRPPARLSHVKIYLLLSPCLYARAPCRLLRFFTADRGGTSAAFVALSYGYYPLVYPCELRQENRGLSSSSRRDPCTIAHARARVHSRDGFCVLLSLSLFYSLRDASLFRRIVITRGTVSDHCPRD